MGPSALSNRPANRPIRARSAGRGSIPVHGDRIAEVDRTRLPSRHDAPTPPSFTLPHTAPWIATSVLLARIIMQARQDLRVDDFHQPGEFAPNQREFIG